MALVCALVAGTVSAQTAAPSTEQMIEQLKAPRTRSLRNLTVEAVPAQTTTDVSQPANSQPVAAVVEVAAPASRPSLSLLIQFDFNSARVRPESQHALANLSQALLSPDLLKSSFAVEGHTDAKGSADYNQKLSQQRAQAVRDFLKSKGVLEGRLVAAGKGSTELANPAEPFSAENRRVRIVNLD